ncbi:MAG: hypothetical protein R6U37_08080 [Dehalococcoidia bacterium]
MAERKQIERIQKKINHIETALADIRQELIALMPEKVEEASTKPKKAKVLIPSPEDLQQQYKAFAGKYSNENAGNIRNELNGLTVEYLRKFCSANSLPIDTKKNAKDAVIDSILQWMAQSVAISADAVTRKNNPPMQ